MLNEKKVMDMVNAKRLKKQKGASMIEYALVVAAIVGVASIFFVGDGTGTLDAAMKTKMESVATSISGEETTTDTTPDTTPDPAPED